MSFTFALFAPRKGTQSVERGGADIFLFRKVLLTLSSKVKSRKFDTCHGDDSNNTLLLWYAVLLRSVTG